MCAKSADCWPAVTRMARVGPAGHQHHQSASDGGHSVGESNKKQLNPCAQFILGNKIFILYFLSFLNF